MMKHKSILILLCLYLFHIISNYVWLRIDMTYLVFDSAQYHLYSLNLLEAIKNSFSAALFSKDLFTYFYKSGLFVGFITVPFYFLFGTSQDAAAMVSGSIFLAILLLSVYGIGRKLKDERAGLLGVFIVSMYPIVFNQLRMYMFDLPLCAFVSLNIYLLICSHYFRDKFFTVLYALSLALGALIKFNFLAFTIGPMVLVLCKGPEWDFNRIKKTQSRNHPIEFKKEDILQKKLFITLLVISAVIILTFGSRSLKLMVSHLSATSWINSIMYFSGGNYSDKGISLIIFWVNNFLVFLATFINESVSFFFSLIFIISLIIVLRLKFKYTAFLLLPVLIPLLFVTFVFNTFGNTVRYMLPSYVFVALISSIGVLNIRAASIRRFIVILILLIGFIQYFSVSYGCGFFPGEIKINFPDFFTFKPPVFFKKVAFLKPPFSYMRPNSYLESVILFRQEIPIFPDKYSSHPQKAYKNRQIINGIMNSCPLKEGDSFIFLDYHYDIADILYPLKFEAFIKTKSENTIKNPFFANYNSFPNQDILTADYIAAMEGMREESNLISLPVLIGKIQKAKEYFYNHLYAFRLVHKVALSNGRMLSIYKNILNDIIEGPLEIKVRKGHVDFFYRGKKITEDNGFNTYFTYDQKRYFSDRAVLVKIQKPDVNCILVHLSWPELDLTQVWEIRSQDGRINWQVYLDNPKKSLFGDFGMEFQLSPVYRNWRDCFKTGHFPETLPWVKSSPPINLEAFADNALAIKPDNFPRNGLPGLLFRNLHENISLYTDFFNQKKTCVFYANHLTPRPEQSKGKFLLFSGQLSLFSDAAEIKDSLGPNLP